MLKEVKVFVEVDAERPTIPIPTDGNPFSLDWQNDLIPDATKTWAQAYGNDCQIKALEDLGGDIFRPYDATVNYNYSGDTLVSLSFYDLFIGKIILS